MNRGQRILPGSTIGVLGSGQLGRMLSIEARKLGYRIRTFSPDSDSPTGALADEEVVAGYDDLEAVRAFVSNVDVVTFEFENVSLEAAAVAAESVPVRPDATLLYTTQHRLREKEFLRSRGFPVTDFMVVYGVEDLERVVGELGDVLLKTAAWGYDGKGQVRVREGESASDAWAALAAAEAIAERVVPFEAELSVVVARSLEGEIVTFDPSRNVHEGGILDLTVCPSGLGDHVDADARQLAAAIASSVWLVGVLCVEMFLTRNGRLLVNELAPRPHNSGHWTFDAAVTSQFEQQVRAVCGLPLGSPRRLSPVAMVNLLGDLWEGGEPDWSAALEVPEVKLHLYGKEHARRGRKMGHITAFGATAAEARDRALEARGRAGGVSDE
jgi:5-(carboxyamino)imidazole ribonucleotide synthase